LQQKSLLEEVETSRQQKSLPEELAITLATQDLKHLQQVGSSFFLQLAHFRRSPGRKLECLVKGKHLALIIAI
jgi:hypothetical protein